jgi:hypothetical protein
LKNYELQATKELLFLVLVVVEKLANILTDMLPKLYMEELYHLQLEQKLQILN